MQLNSFPQTQQSSISTERKIKIFDFLSTLNFSGKIIWRTNRGPEWVFFLDAGRVLYATGGKHPLKRWNRILHQQKLETSINTQLRQVGLNPSANLKLLDHEEYQQLCNLIQIGKLDQKIVAKLFYSILEETILDIFLSKDARFSIIEESSLPNSSRAVKLNEEKLFNAASLTWQRWQDSNLCDYLPDQVPVIRQPERIREKTNQQLFDVLVTLLDGRNTLRDLAIKMNRDIIQVTQALKSFIELGWVDLRDIPDIKPSASPKIAPTKTEPIKSNGTENPTSAPGSGESKDIPELKPDPNILVACVDDSPLVCQSMEQIIKSSGYQFLGILDPLRVLPTLLAKNPDIIFLDLVMPYTNGYEICSRLRKVSKFSTTPIVILSGNDGVVDQVKARLIGATDFVSKPVNPGIILKTISRYLMSSAPAYQSNR